MGLNELAGILEVFREKLSTRDWNSLVTALFDDIERWIAPLTEKKLMVVVRSDKCKMTIKLPTISSDAYIQIETEGASALGRLGAVFLAYYRDGYNNKVVQVKRMSQGRWWWMMNAIEERTVATLDQDVFANLITYLLDS